MIWRAEPSAGSGGDYLAAFGVENKIVAWRFRGDLQDLPPSIFQTFGRFDPNWVAVGQLHENVEFQDHDRNLQARPLRLVDGQREDQNEGKLLNIFISIIYVSLKAWSKVYREGCSTGTIFSLACTLFIPLLPNGQILSLEEGGRREASPVGQDEKDGLQRF
jgi:hypothetical protein